MAERMHTAGENCNEKENSNAKEFETEKSASSLPRKLHIWRYLQLQLNLYLLPGSSLEYNLYKLDCVTRGTNSLD